MIKSTGNYCGEGRLKHLQSSNHLSLSTDIGETQKHAIKHSGKKKSAVPAELLLKNNNAQFPVPVNVEKMRDKVLDIVTENFEYFKENPKHLAWAMMNYELLHRVGRRYFDDCQDNPKYPVIELGEKIDKDPRYSNASKIKNSDLIYDAWAVTVSNNDEFPDINPELPLEAKPNKTMEEWISLFTDKKYEYNNMFPDAWSVKNYLLCVIGTGYGWNENGFLTKTGPSGVDEVIFAGYTRAEDEIRKDIKGQINKLYSNPVIAEKVKKYIKNVKIYAGKNEAEKTILTDGWKLEEKIQNMPEKEKSKIKDAFRYVCYLEAVCNEAKNWTDDEWSKARKSSIFDYHGTKFDVSEASLDFSTSSYSFISLISMMSKKDANTADAKDYRVDKLMSLRRVLWRDFINQIDDPKDPEVIRAQKIVSELSKKELAEIFNPEKKVLTDKERAELIAAREYLDTRKPNRRYQELYDIVEKKEAEEAAKTKTAKTLDRLSGVPSNGWDTIYFISKKEDRIIGDFISGSENNSGAKKTRKYYPLSEYSNMVRMPENAHPSYIKTAILISKEILANPDETEESKKYARELLAASFT